MSALLIIHITFSLLHLSPECGQLSYHSLSAFSHSQRALIIIIITPFQLVKNTLLYLKCATSPYNKLSLPFLKHLCLLTYTLIFNYSFFLGFSLLNSIYGYLCLNPVMHFNENTNMYLYNQP